MAPEGFAVIVPSPGISPLGLVASTAFSVRSKSNHLLSLWAVDPRPQWERRANRTTQTLTCVMESRTIQRELPMTAVIMTLWNSEKYEILRSIFYSCTSSREFQKKKKICQSLQTQRAEDLLGDFVFFLFLFSPLCMSIWSKESVFRNDTPGKGGGRDSITAFKSPPSRLRSCMRTDTVVGSLPLKAF